MAIKGAILGDIAGSQFEAKRSRNPMGCYLYSGKCSFTDDTVTSLAIKMACDKGMDFATALMGLCRKYPRCGYAGRFYDWVFGNDSKPYGSWGNGSAMRVSYVADFYDDLEEVKKKAKESAEVTHNDPEGIKGAVVTAVCIWMAKHGKSKDEIYDYVLEEYPPRRYKYSIEDSVDKLEREYRWDVSCQGSVPVAMRCFYESDSYESFIRNVFRLECDCDTLCAIGGGVAEEFYHGVDFDGDDILKLYLNKELWDILNGNY